MIIAVVGPTGVGKTSLSLALAKEYNGEIINADSTQIYKEINIGTAKITDLEGVVHHLLDIKTLDEDYSIYDFQRDARKIIAEILNRNKAVVIAGGSGLYISALLYDYKFHDEEKIKNTKLPSFNLMTAKLEDIGIKIDENNHQRIARSYIKYVINKEEITSNKPTQIYDSIIIGLTTDREELYQRINNRVHNMMSEGLEKEAKYLLNKYPDSKQLKTTIGYKEFVQYFKADQTIEDVIKSIQQNSRRYAKRQYTWFNNQMEVKWFNTNYDDFNQTIKEIKAILKK